MTTKQKILLVVRFLLFTGLWYIMVQIVCGLIYGFWFAEHSHDPNTSTEEHIVALECRYVSGQQTICC